MRLVINQVKESLSLERQTEADPLLVTLKNAGKLGQQLKEMKEKMEKGKTLEKTR
ncbi:MAG: hypothetical protein IPJ26_16430 [Bacteroidetes bacterium]|nr:hypothetical protein [Bacteroidota bacterium]